MNSIIHTAEQFFLFYFIGLYMGYMSLNFLSIFAIRRFMQTQKYASVSNTNTGLELPVTLIAPAYNEAETVVDSVYALLQLTYPKYEVLIVNDGSTDNTLDILKKEFDLVEYPEAYRNRIDTEKINMIYVSKKRRNLRVIDKQNGGKADSLNAAINISRYPLFCAVDADSLLQPDSLERVVQAFIEYPETVAAGGTVRIVNGCTISKGFVQKVGIPKNLLARLQVAEYLRAFLFGRLGWEPLNALLIISGAFGLFHKETVISVGGYKTDMIGEDMELIVRLHRIMRKNKKKYRISYVPDPICWTEAPEDLKTLKLQRIRWQRGLTESLTSNISLMFSRNGGVVGWVAMPFMFFFECLGPFIELFGYITISLGFFFGYLSWENTLFFFVVALGFGVMLSSIAVLLEEMSFHIYPSGRYIFILLFVAIIENFGYRQLNSLWRIIAMYQWLTGEKANWGEMKRNASWKTSITSDNTEK